MIKAIPRSELRDTLYPDYYDYWVSVYKEGVVADCTYKKWDLAGRQLRRLAPNLKIRNMSADDMQQILSRYSVNHEHATILDFWHAIAAPAKRLFAYEGVLKRDPTYGIVVPEGKPAKKKKKKFLEPEELERLIKVLEFDQSTYSDGIMITIRTGVRFGELLGITPKDVDLKSMTLNINKTWDYKRNATLNDHYNEFKQTKNKYSVRKIAMDSITAQCFQREMGGCKDDETIFGTNTSGFNSTWNNTLARICKFIDIPVMSIHGLRHEHASFLASQGVPTKTIAARLGHVDDRITNKVYIHETMHDQKRDARAVMDKLADMQ